MTKLSASSTKKELEARRDEIALEHAELTAEHRRLGAFLNAKNIDLSAMKAEQERLSNIIETTEMALEVNSDG